jgi:hypothetical protein
MSATQGGSPAIAPLQSTPPRSGEWNPARWSEPPSPHWRQGLCPLVGSAIGASSTHDEEPSCARKAEGKAAPESLRKEQPVRQHLIETVLVIACALGLFLISAWVQSSGEMPMFQQLLHIIRQRGHVTVEADRLLSDKIRIQHTSGQSD